VDAFHAPNKALPSSSPLDLPDFDAQFSSIVMLLDCDSLLCLCYTKRIIHHSKQVARRHAKLAAYE
jgi:hypothetical protein